ncbi:aromatic acid/H+ symport family MFS transporter [Leifsonia sp. PS1209]|uniref:MFS transporter n=1 Tax=Leifsonia sp. PS1209 TaxID=2724914 RepID=UPI001442CFEF|nr:aromatic acid/H+ symport family MFS transporter [Leifsonia sp. PS1209]QIZ98933.1 aromatic acid/H+ symport family MFS transporter [Leifsonia sp. PS1209]
MTSSPPSTARVWPVILCWIVVALDGFDLVVLGTVIPTLISTGALGFDPGGATAVATAGLVGVGIGALAVGPLTDRYGRRATLITCVALFSVFTIAVVAAPNVFVFGALRLLAGLGLGACIPTVLAYVGEFAGSTRTGRSTTLTMTGYHAGAVLTALLALAIVPNWQLMFLVGGLAGLVVLPLLWFTLPESAAVLARRADGAARPAGTVGVLVRRPYLLASIGIWTASFMGLLLVYGLNTWLPQLMKVAGYDTGDALGLLLVLNLGAVAGLVLAGTLADRNGTKRVTLVWFFLAAVFLALLSIRMDEVVLLYAAIFVTGVFVFSAQVLVYAFVSQLYPPEVRGTALGFAAGIGRIGAIAGPAITGVLVTLDLAYPGGFYVFAVAALISVASIATVPAVIRRREGAPVVVSG